MIGSSLPEPAVRRAFAGTVLALALGVLGCAGTGSDPDAADVRPASAAALGSCPEGVRPLSLRCATLEVPLERADPSLGTTEIRYAVRPRSERSRPSLGTIFAAEGGPGYGSIPSARSYVNLFGPLLRRRELVVVDTRGTGHSHALDCRDLQAGRGPDELGVAQCARWLGDRYGAYRTSAAADDIDDVRRALGLRRIDLYGDSYGTYLAQSYAFRHGDSLRALVLDSAYPVRGESPWYPSLWRDGIRSLATACRRSPGCHGDARARLGRLVRQLRRRDRGVGPLLDVLSFAGNGPPGSYLRIDRAARSFLAGDLGSYERLVAVNHLGFGNQRYYSRGLELAVSCNDYPMLWDKAASEPERRRQLERAVREYPKDRFEPFTPREVAIASEAGYLECLGWPAPSELYEPPAAPDATAPDVPTLVISGELDNVTSPTEARRVADDFPDSRLAVIRGAGHVPSLYGSLYPAAGRVRAFLRRHG